MSEHSGGRDHDAPGAAVDVLVPVAPSATLRETVEYVVDSTLERVESAAGGSSSDEDSGPQADSRPSDAPDAETPPAPASPPPAIHFVYVHAPDEFDPDDETPALDDADELLDRVRVWAEEDAGGEEYLDVHTGHVGSDRYLFSPADVAAALIDAARERGVERIVLDPEYDPGVGAPLLRPLTYELSRDSTLTIEEAPVQQQVRRAPLVGRSSARRIGTLLGLSFLFYQVLAGAFSAFDLVTGGITAIVVAGSLSRISFGRDPTLTDTPLRVARGILYLPYLFWEILVANVAVAAVILDPRRVIDPQMTRIRPAVYGALPITSLANSITLTPGTLTVRVQGRELLVHTLIPGAREDLFDGSLERAIRFVFYGRRAMRIDSLRDRDAAEVVTGPAPSTDASRVDGQDGSGGDQQ
ncbi:monovalent cation/H+ antiporter subunit E [Salinarchaeum sp. Harcht-Bsk1]|uniref:monovalent cation/H+ antiporter subunit E n=1 Tax=Salinarchaeum sp. Harcht-Bsk1 TaxID=1333523 RepID=UPI0003424699|nr:monovalent cation/H+ antiporter subunit E [Salinarchaeum sp. Harcht-Bsk1]AGN00099.1 monovalent cation/H+ antiporter subunit E [Salinarchaeum sp. Harcht-Bsk1]